MNSISTIPEKKHFKMNEVCTITSVKSYVLRFWETEFEEIQPIESESGQKMYTYADVELILQIKKLLFEDKFTVEKAKYVLRTKEDEIEVLDDLSITLDLFESIESDQEVKQTQEKEMSSMKAESFLSDSDLQKLILAKAKLSSLLKTTKSLQAGHNWV
jgi:DNA-binding transcriptional MerR regulator